MKRVEAAWAVGRVTLQPLTKLVVRNVPPAVVITWKKDS